MQIGFEGGFAVTIREYPKLAPRSPNNVRNITDQAKICVLLAPNAIEYSCGRSDDDDENRNEISVLGVEPVERTAVDGTREGCRLNGIEPEKHELETEYRQGRYRLVSQKRELVFGLLRRRPD